MQDGEITRNGAMAGVFMVVLVTLLWAWKTLVAENRRQAAAIELKGV
jgi:hypothetical protein